jgi:hypothetical protein
VKISARRTLRELEISMPTELSEDAHSRYDEREAIAAAAAVEAVLARPEPSLRPAAR